jgi:hypothetical protein
MTPLILIAAGVCAIAILGYCAVVVCIDSKPTEFDREELRREIERRERAHQPRREVRKQFIEATRRELLS